MRQRPRSDSRAARRGLRPARRRGATLAELLVALGILVVGLLALAGSAAQLARAESRASADAAAASVIADRVERLAAAPCADTGGTSARRALVERWQTWTLDSVPWLADTTRYAIVGDPSRAAGVSAPARCAP